MKRAILFIFLLASTSSFGQDAVRPNIVLINIDDLGWRDLGFMGTNFYHTPNIDKLAINGTTFTNAYAAASNCAPSRASLFTGKWTTRHGIYTVESSERGASKNRKLIPTQNNVRLDSSFLSIGKILKDNGYTNCHAGKWHIGDSPKDYGFDVNIGGSHAGNPGTYYPPYKNVNIEADNGEYLTDLIMKKTLEFVDTVQGPFFLNYAPYAVHTPIQGVKSLEYKYIDKPADGEQNNIEYATMIENLDRNIGLLLKELEVKNVMDNTLIFLTSDNGGLIGVTSQEPLRSGKGSYYEGGIRVPFLVVYKDHFANMTTSEIPVSHLDILPTIIDIIKIDSKNNELDGESLITIIGDSNKYMERPLFWHFPIYLEANAKQGDGPRDPLFRTRPGSVIRLGDWKLHHYFEDDGLELYNLKDDVSERKNLALLFPHKTKELYDTLKEWRENVNAPIPSILNPDYESISKD